jgi:hypothetical protein
MTAWSRPERTRLLVVTLGRAACVLCVAAAALLLGSVLSGGRSSSWVWLGATVVVAMTVAATRASLERLADRVAYGPEGDPYAQLSQFVQRISDTLALDEVLPHVARTVTRALHSPRGEVRLWLADGQEWRQTWPLNQPEGVVNVDVPLQHRGEQVGVLGVDTVTGDLSRDERALLDRLAGTAGLALANVRLAYDLRRRLAESQDLADRLERSRQRLLDAAQEETERFSRLVDLQVLGRLRSVEQALESLAQGDGLAADRAVEAATQALATLRELAAGVFPPALSDRGLADALEEYCLRFEAVVTFRWEGRRERMPFAVEAGAYFCAVLVVEDGAAVEQVDVRVHQGEDQLTLETTTHDPPGAETLQRLEDRVNATDGSLSHPGAAPDGRLTMTWDLTAAAGGPRSMSQEPRRVG